MIRIALESTAHFVFCKIFSALRKLRLGAIKLFKAACKFYAMTLRQFLPVKDF